MVEWGSVALNTSGALFQALMYVVYICAGLAAVWFVWLIFQYRIKVVVRIHTGSKCLVVMDKAREYKNEDGGRYWKLWNMKEKFPRPPAHTINLTKKGKMWHETYYTEQGMFIPVQDKGGSMDVGSWGLDFVNINQRISYLNEIRKAEMYKKKKFMDYLVAAAPILAVVMIITVFMLFFDDAVQPFVQIAGEMDNMVSRFERMMDMQKEVLQNVQVLRPQSSLVQGPPEVPELVVNSTS